MKSIISTPQLDARYPDAHHPDARYPASANAIKAPISPTSAPASAPALAPALAQALGSLSINLEDELNRYRRQRQGQVPPKPQQMRMKVHKKPVDLISIPARPVKAQTLSPSATYSVPQPSPNLAAPPPPPPNPFLQNQARRDTLSTLSSSTVPQRKEATFDRDQVGHLAVSDAPGPEAQSNPALVSTQSAPDDYLASSAELINSFAEATTPEPKSLKRKSLVVWPDSLSSPLGIGALMVVLIGSAGFGYALTNPGVLGQIPLVRRLMARSEATPPGVSDDQADLFGSDPLQGTGPDLSEREFRDLDLESLSTLEVEPGVVSLAPGAPSAEAASTATTTTNPETDPDTETATATQSEPTAGASVGSASTQATRQQRSQSPAQPSQAQTSSPRQAAAQSRPSTPAAPSPQQSSPPAQSTPAPAAATSNTPSATGTASTETAPNQGGSHHVVTDFTGDQSLRNAREVVGDAYLHNYSSGARIQLGTYDTPEAARQRAEELRNQGIPARVQGE